jgi:hypothetical protein
VGDTGDTVAATNSTRPRPTSLELASGMPYGDHPIPQLPHVPGSLSPRAALEDAMRPWLASGRCFTGFSGGRDSSAILAVATQVARREGLPVPVPVTIRYRGVLAADESAWQEQLIRHLGIRDWIRIDVDDELDYLGPVATSLLRRHGVIWPPYFHYEHLLLEQASGGVLLSGHDGDGVFGWWRWRGLSSVLNRRRWPKLGDVANVALAAAPRGVRRWEFHRRRLPLLSWLQPTVRATVERGLAEEYASQPRRWDRWPQWVAQRRTIALGLATIDMLARATGTVAAHPFLDLRFLSALAGDGGRTGYGERSDVMAALFADALPAGVVRRRGKAGIGGGLWRGPSRAFATDWDGQGVDEKLVDPVALREAWAVPCPKIGAVAVLQGAWLASVEQGRLPEDRGRTKRDV